MSTHRTGRAGLLTLLVGAGTLLMLTQCGDDGGDGSGSDIAATIPVGSLPSATAAPSTDTDVSTIQTLVAEHDIRQIVIGMPFELSGKIGHRAKRVLEFANARRWRVCSNLLRGWSDQAAGL